MAALEQQIGTKGVWKVRCFDTSGSLKWEDNWENLVVNEGLDYALDAALTNGTQISTWYIGLTDGGPTPAAGDTMASHAGWTEVTAYDEAARQAWTGGSVSSQTVNNSASPATFTGSTNGTTVGGAFLVSDNTKGGTAGTLFSIGAFQAGNKTLDDGDTLEVTAEYSNSSS